MSVGVDPALHCGHEGRGGDGQSAAGGERGADRDAAGLPAPRRHGGPHPAAVAVRLRALERAGGPGQSSLGSELSPRGKPGSRTPRGMQDRFLAAVQAEEAGEKQRAIELYQEIMELDPQYAPACINLGTIHFHLREFDRAEELYRQATVADPDYVLAFFDLGNVLDELERLDESIVAYGQAVALSPRYADAHYNLALAHERKGERRPRCGTGRRMCGWTPRSLGRPRTGQIRKLLSREKLAIARAESFIPPQQGDGGEPEAG